jgi:hypothetical protein
MEPFSYENHDLPMDELSHKHPGQENQHFLVQDLELEIQVRFTSLFFYKHLPGCSIDIRSVGFF